MWMRLAPVLRGVVVLLFCAVNMLTGSADARAVPESQKRACKTDDFLRIQETCRMENDDLLLAVKRHDDGMVCRKLVDLFYCVAGHVPLCFHNVTTMYKSYFHSPHNCALSQQQIISLQNLTTHTAQNQGAQGEVDVEVDIIVPLSTPSPENTSSEEKGQEEEREEGGGGGRGMRQEQQNGSDGDTGNAAAEMNHCILPLVVMSWLGTWQMTSYLLLS